MKTHYRDIFTRKSECGVSGEKLTWNMEEVTCMECLKSIKKEWEKQREKFSGYPRVNAIRRLTQTNNIIKRIKEINS